MVGLLALDIVVGSLRPHAVGFREAALWSAFYIAVAIVFGLVVGRQAGFEYGAQYFAGYVVEKSLSIDNLFVFLITMSTFAVPSEYQKKVLSFGIVLALVVRGIFIALGAALLALFTFVFLLFGLLLIWTAIQLYRHRNEEPDIEANPLVRAARRFLPISDRYDGRLLLLIDGRLTVTPLFIVLVAIGGADILFALDSIPAVFGVTNEPFIVFTANAFALLGLRPLFFLIGGLLKRLVYLSSGLALILGLIGAKLVLHWGHTVDGRVPVVSTEMSLIVIGVLLAITTVASIIKSWRDPAARAHPGAVAVRSKESSTMASE